MVSRNFWVFILGCFLIRPGFIQAAPVISGVSGAMNHGGLITLHGSAFGTRGDFNSNHDTWQGSDYLPYRFKDFADGSAVSHGFGYWNGSTGISVKTGSPNADSHYLEVNNFDDGDERRGIQTDLSGAGTFVYVTFKFMLPPVCQSGKFWRIYADSPQNNIYLSTGGNGDYHIRGFSECSSCPAQTEWGAGPEVGGGIWRRFELRVDTHAGQVSACVDGVEAWTRTDWLVPDFSGWNGHSMDFPNMLDNTSRGEAVLGSYNYDDIYIDFSGARIEIGNAPSWGACTRREIQIAASWSDTDVLFRLNQGAFSPGAAWLYVMNENGEVNAAGFPITLGGAAGGSPPQPPRNLQTW